MNPGAVIGSALLGALGLAVAGPTTAHDFELGVSTGIAFSSGDYGGDVDIEETYVPVGLTATYGRVAVGVHVPYLNVATEGQAGRTNENGLGDVSASLAVFDVLYSAEKRLALDVSGVIKLGTADEAAQLGTGENDFAVYLDGYKFLDNVTLLGTLGYRWRGEPPGTELDNVLIGSVGAALFTENGTMYGGTLDYRQSAIAGEDDVREVRAFVALPLSETWDLELHAFAGFTDSSPDWGGGITFAADLRRFPLRAPR